MNIFCKSCGKPKKVNYKTAQFCSRVCANTFNNKLRIGKPHKVSEETKRKISENHHNVSGKNNPRYIDGRSTLVELIRSLTENKEWKFKVYQRDGFKCRRCGKEAGGKLEAHHIIPFKQLFAEFINEYSQFSPLEDKETLLRLAVTYKPFWDVGNGISDCEECHKIEHAKR